jgi:hypothetical protein
MAIFKSYVKLPEGKWLMIIILHIFRHVSWVNDKPPSHLPLSKWVAMPCLMDDDGKKAAHGSWISLKKT